MHETYKLLVVVFAPHIVITRLADVYDKRASLLFLLIIYLRSFMTTLTQKSTVTIYLLLSKYRLLAKLRFSIFLVLVGECRELPQ